MSDEKKQLKEEATPVIKENISVEAPIADEAITIQTDLDKEDREELARGFSMDSVDEEEKRIRLGDQNVQS